MTVTVFVDTNVLVYSRDDGHPEEQGRARAWLDEVARAGTPKLSFQVLVELYSVITSKLSGLVTEAVVRDLVVSLLPWDPIGPSAALIDAAWRVQDRFGLSWWDAQIVAAAQLQGCAYLLTEDLQHGQRFGDLTVVSPFQATAADILR
ncbi:MAG: PIN domain-containing protein [Dehalococcoidia bacterium]